METVFQQLLSKGVEPRRAAEAIARHIKLTGATNLLTSDMVSELNVPLPVDFANSDSATKYDPMDDLSDGFSGRLHKWSKHKMIAEVLLYFAYKQDTAIVKSQEQILQVADKLFKLAGVGPRLPDGSGFRLILSRLRTGNYYSGLPKIDTSGPTVNGLVSIEPRLAELDEILGVEWPDWLKKVQNKKRKNA